ncbi:MAG: hypothetical protein HY421_00900 [Candidatus Kerfeldbacteria bacterium]|nr:hypothetical protein [Candidatus Kerfeldbacteria bacterium]
MPQQYLDAFFSGDGDLRVLTACPFCNTSYTVRAARVLAQKDDAHVVHIECRNCGGSIVALILAGNLGAQSVGVVTDLTRDEVARFSGAAPVNVDDVLGLHHQLTRDLAPAAFLSVSTS